MESTRERRKRQLYRGSMPESGGARRRPRVEGGSGPLSAKVGAFAAGTLRLNVEVGRRLDRGVSPERALPGRNLAPSDETPPPKRSNVFSYARPKRGQQPPRAEPTSS